MYLLTQKKRTVLQLLLLKTMMKALLQKNKGIGMYIPVVEPAFFLIKKNWMCMEHLLPGLFEILLNFKFSVRFVKIQEVQYYCMFQSCAKSGYGLHMVLHLVFVCLVFTLSFPGLTKKKN